MTEPSPPPLDYGSPPPLVRTPRFQRWIIRDVVALLLLSSIAWAPNLWHNVRAAYWERRCMTYAAPPDAVVYEADLVTGQVLVQKTVPEWDAYYGFIKYAPTPKAAQPVLFLHARETRETGPQLIVVELGRINTLFGQMQFDTSTPHAPTLSDPPMVRTGGNTMPLPGLKGARHLRLYAGEPNQNTPSCFTIRYEIDGRKGTIDGRLDLYGDVHLRVLTGPATIPSD